MDESEATEASGLRTASRSVRSSSSTSECVDAESLKRVRTVGGGDAETMLDRPYTTQNYLGIHWSASRRGRTGSRVSARARS